LLSETGAFRLSTAPVRPGEAADVPPDTNPLTLYFFSKSLIQQGNLFTLKI